ncbi:MAG: F0F1 ATP synthase subunit epsilon [Pseudoclavibacter sp.]
MAGKGELTVKVVEATKLVWEGSATMVVARTSEGEIGILSGHEPVLAALGAGQVRITATDGSKIVANAEGGFLSVNSDVVTVVAGEAELVSGE